MIKFHVVTSITVDSSGLSVISYDYFEIKVMPTLTVLSPHRLLLLILETASQAYLRWSMILVLIKCLSTPPSNKF